MFVSMFHDLTLILFFQDQHLLCSNVQIRCLQSKNRLNKFSTQTPLQDLQTILWKIFCETQPRLFFQRMPATRATQWSKNRRLLRLKKSTLEQRSSVKYCSNTNNISCFTLN